MLAPPSIRLTLFNVDILFESLQLRFTAPNLGDLAKKLTPICAVHHYGNNATLDAPQSRGKHHGSVPSDSSPDIVFWVQLLSL